jgi:transforming growth factor-beta-induced protein
MSGIKGSVSTFALALTIAFSIFSVSCTARGEQWETTDAAKSDVVDTAVAAGNFKTLEAALKAGGLVQTLKGEGPFTVFAPTDEAFAKLPAGTLEDLLKPENKEKLIAILKYHVVAAKAMSKDVAGMSSAKTVNGQELTLKTEGGKVMVNDATVTKADVEATNGVIHVIDTVLIPR